MAEERLHSREQSNTEARDDTAHNHDPEARGKGLNGAADSEHDGAGEKRAPPSYTIANASSSDRGY